MIETSTIKTTSSTALLNDTLFIIEKMDSALDVKSNDEKQGIVLEGICAIFGVKNNNRRVYEKAEYLPHLSYLKEKISKRQLLGELDHPQRFDVSLQAASHIVEDIWHDGGDKVHIRVRILEDTPMGKIAKALVESGCQLSISSRAAGQVLNEGKVKLQRIFTYDLVGEPGFTEAILNKVNESAKENFQLITESFNNIKEDSIVNKLGLTDIHESLNFADNYEVYEINNKKEFDSVLETEAPKNNYGMSEYVTKAEIDGYTELMKSKMSGISEAVEANKAALESLKNSGSITESEEYPQLIEHINYLGEQLENAIAFSNYLAEKLGHTIKYNEHVAGVVNNLVDENKKLDEKVNKGIGYSEYVGKRLNESINYSEHITKHLNKNIKYNKYLAEMLDKSIRYAEYVGERTEHGIKYAEYVAEKGNHLVGFANYLAENLQKGIKYTEYIAEKWNNEVFTGKRKAAGAVNESFDAVEELTATVDEVLEQIKNDSVDAVLENKFPFLKVLNEEDKKKFNELDNKLKGAIVETLNKAVWFSREDVISIMDAVVEHANKDIPNYIKLMPNEYKEVFTQMNEAELNRLHSRAQLYTLNTPYQVKTFWDEMDFFGINERIENEKREKKIQQLNESQSTEGKVDIDRVNEAMRGYDNGFLDQIKRWGDRTKG